MLGLLMLLLIVLLGSLGTPTSSDTENITLSLEARRNPCMNAPCHNGICVNIENNTAYRCYCINGYTGLTCRTNFDDCLFKPCQNGATCMDGVAQVLCICPEGFAGIFCEENINECLSNPCLNGATCTDLVNGYTCHCLPGYLGRSCEIDVDVCINSSFSLNTTVCQNGGTCVDGPGETFNCSCPEGYVGEFCEQDLSECISSPCLHGGHCVEAQGNFSCICPFHWTGRYCEVELQECEENICQNDAMCLVEVPYNASFKLKPPECFCVPDFHGQFCERRYNECLVENACENGGTCVDGIDNYKCSCPPGFSGWFCEAVYNSTENSTFCSNSEASDLCFTSYQTEFLTRSLPLSTTDFDLPSGTFESQMNNSVISWTLVSSSSTEEFSETFLSYLSHTTISPVEESISTFELFTSFNVDSSDISVNIDTSLIRSDEYFSTTDFLENETLSLDIITSVLETSPLDVSSVYSFSDIRSNSDLLSSEDHSTIFIPIVSEFSSSEYFEPSSFTTVLDQNISSDFQSPFEGTISESTESSPFFESEDFWSSKTTHLQNYNNSVSVTISSDFSSSEGSDLLPNSSSTFVSDYNGYSVFSTRTLPSAFDQSKPDLTALFTPSSECENCDFSFSIWNSSTSWPTIPTIPPDDCQDLACQNGGTVFVFRGNNSAATCQCVCRLNFGGPRCELEVLLSIPYFNGFKSYIEHKITGVTLQKGLYIVLSFRTSNQNGMLLYTQAQESTFVLLSIQAGQLTFTFSCGPQVTVFVERGLNVTQSDFTSVSLGLQWIPFGGESGDCEAWMNVNASSYLTGSQRIQGSSAPDFTFSSLYLGGLPDDLSNLHSNSVQLLPSFTGCMKDLQVNGQEHEIIEGATRGAAVSECRTGGCSLSPCHNGGTCHSTTTSWYCICNPGFTGSFCEHTTCRANPCLFGGTCLPQMMDTYLCLCPYGRHGKVCQQSMQIVQPAYFGNLQGYSSYLQYLIPGNVQGYLEVRFRFTLSNTLPNNTLLFYMGQTDLKDSMTDFFALGLDNGYSVFIYNLGSGTRQIRSPQALDRALAVHSVQFGHQRRYGWLSVDNNDRKAIGLSEGHLTSLNVAPNVFFGGHSSFQFAHLPPLLKNFEGFKGCIFDEEWRTNVWGPFSRFQKVHSGRNLHQCQVDECQLAGCANGASCITEGATFRCVCTKGWTGNLCTERETPCTSGKHTCSSGSVCVPNDTGYTCDCPLGYAGQNCQFNETLSDVHFSGLRSYMAFEPKHIRKTFHLALGFQTLSPEGILFYTAQHSNDHAGDFASLILHKGFVQFRFNLGTGFGRTLILQSKQQVESGVWYYVEAGRNGTHGYLSLDGANVSGYSQPGMSMLDSKLPFFLGGLEDLSSLNKEAYDGSPSWFKGCMRFFKVNQHQYQLNEKGAIGGRNLEDCDGTACGFDKCLNNGLCIPQDIVFHCQCTQQFQGMQCEMPVQCSIHHCHNGGTCFLSPSTSLAQCDCALGWSGPQCLQNEEEEEEFSAPSFRGDGYMLFVDKDYDKLDLKETKISFNFSTYTPSGLMLWNGQAVSDEEDYLGVGLQDGRLYLVWNLGWLSSGQILTANKGMDDGEWHTVSINRLGRTLTLQVDNQIYESHVDGDYLELNTRGYYYIGGFPRSEEISILTSSHFSSSFHGCLSDIQLGKENVNVTSGANVQNCSRRT